MLLFASCLVTSSAFPLLGPTPALPQFHPEWQLDRLDSGRSIGLTRYQEPPKWMNPCGGVVVDADSSSPSDTKIAAYAILDVQLALNYVHQFKDRFVSLPFDASSIKFIPLPPFFILDHILEGSFRGCFRVVRPLFKLFKLLRNLWQVFQFRVLQLFRGYLKLFFKIDLLLPRTSTLSTRTT